MSEVDLALYAAGHQVRKHVKECVVPCPCSNSRCGCDFSTREKGKPDLSSIEVVSDIFFEAARKTAGRLRALEEGTLSPEELAAAQEHLADWIGATFSGKTATTDPRKIGTRRVLRPTRDVFWPMKCAGSSVLFRVTIRKRFLPSP